MKRCFDIAASALALVVLSPILIATWIAVRLFIGSPALFSQTRAGLKGDPFTLVKFRSMTNERGEDGELLPDDQRLTRFGKILRATSLDELPELMNVLRGDMSLVGPRPLFMSYVPLYSERQIKRLDVRPGITGWAQVNGRNAVGWAERFEMDVWYVENRTLLLDLKILWRTVIVTLARTGISAENEVTMHKFTGNSDEAQREDG